MSQYLQTIALRDVKCYAYHGFYPEEQLTGGWFSVDVITSFIPSGPTEDLQCTVNYEGLNTIILEEMKRTRQLLETVVKEILEKTIASFPFIRAAEVVITKHDPPMKGQVGSSVVGLKFNLDNGIY
ncbi:MAG: dihydroneopterin aldolase [Pedobacter sp.]|nr:MAG: dihydroneopterin aldolase [Pedobacter sp.]